MPITRTVRRGSRSVRRSVLISAVLSAGAALSGCAGAGSQPAVTFPSATVAPPFNLNATASGAAVNSAADATSVATAITVKITASDPVIGAYPKGWGSFTLVVSNSSGTDVQNVVPLVVFGPCTCNPAGGGVAPHYQFQILDAMSGKWTPAAAVSATANGTYTFERQTDPATLAAHQSLTYQYRFILSGKQTGIRNGTGKIDVYLIQQPGHERLTDAGGPDASLSLAYHVN